METLEKKSITFERLPKLDCGVCGYRTCEEFAVAVDNSETSLKMCIHLKHNGTESKSIPNCIECKEAGQMGEKMGWKDHLKRDRKPSLLEKVRDDPRPFDPGLVRVHDQIGP